MALGCEPVEDVSDPGCPATPICNQNAVLSCGEEAGVKRTECGALRCASDAPVAQCVPPTALPCQVGDAALRCENGRIVKCDEEALYFLLRPCESGQFCAGEGEPRCVGIANVSCNPDLWSPLCIEGERLTCTPQGRLEANPAECES